MNASAMNMQPVLNCAARSEAAALRLNVSLREMPGAELDPIRLDFLRAIAARLRGDPSSAPAPVPGPDVQNVTPEAVAERAQRAKDRIGFLAAEFELLTGESPKPPPPGR